MPYPLIVFKRSVVVTQNKNIVAYTCIENTTVAEQWLVNNKVGVHDYCILTRHISRSMSHILMGVYYKFFEINF